MRRKGWRVVNKASTQTHNLFPFFFSSCSSSLPNSSTVPPYSQSLTSRVTRTLGSVGKCRWDANKAHILTEGRDYVSERYIGWVCESFKAYIYLRYICLLLTNGWQMNGEGKEVSTLNKLFRRLLKPAPDFKIIKF